MSYTVYSSVTMILKRFLFLICISVLSVACSSSTKQQQVVSEAVPKPSVIEAPAVPSNAPLTESQLADIEQIHERFSAVYPISLEETIENFKQNPETNREIEVWKKMVESFDFLTKDKQYKSLAAQQEVFSVILASTMMPLKSMNERLEFKELEEDEVIRIHNLFMNSFSKE